MPENLGWLDFAVKVEQKGIRFYISCNGQTQNLYAKELFSWLAGEKREHERVLQQLLDNIKKQKNADLKWFFRREQRIFEEKETEKIKDWAIAQMLNKAMRFEEGSLEIYAKATMEDACAKQILQRLIRDETCQKERIKQFGRQAFDHAYSSKEINK
jgi:rubrerythrin